MRWAVLPVLAAGLGLALTAQEDRDFLTPFEVDQIREVPEPNERLQLYLKFARLRMELLEQALAKDKPGRSLLIHNTLEDYSKIIDAMDSLTDDALRHHQAIDKGMVAVANAESTFLEKLNKISASEPRDLDRYKFVLQEAIDATTDSRELSLEDSKKRSADLASGDTKERKDREALMPKQEVKERKKAEADAADQQEKHKIPSLYKPGEKPPDPPQ